MSDETPVDQPGGRMTRDDLVRRLVDLQREIGSTANGAHCYGVWARRIGEMIAALAAPPAAPLANLAARLRKFVTEYRKMVRLDPEMVYALHSEHEERFAPLLLSDLDAAAAALAAPPAAPPADLVALAQQWRDRARRLLREADGLTTSMGYAQRLAAEAEGLDRAADQLSALLVAPRVPDTPQCVIGVYCQRHGFMHGQEAEELREHLEALSLPAVNRVLDEVDARDSLAYLEATNEPTPPDVAPPQEPPR